MTLFPQATPQQFVRLSQEQRIMTLHIERPEALNALNEAILRELGARLTEVANNEEVVALRIVTAGEKAFVAGADIKEMQGMSPAQAEKFSALGSEVFALLEQLPCITIAQVQGFALGGGLELALAADIIIASEKARFGFPEVSLGIIPGFGGTQRLAKRVGSAKALEWIATANKYSAAEAAACGLVNRVVAPEALGGTVEEILMAISKNGPQAIRAAKKALRVGTALRTSEGCTLESSLFGLRFQTPEATEGLAAFSEKRAAKF